MKLLLVLTVAILGANASTDSEQWASFKQAHGKQYRSLREEQQRFSTFQANLRKIESHNEQYQKGEKSYYLGVTPFADLTHEEYLSLFNKSAFAAIPTTEVVSLDLVPAAAVPDEIDWRTKGVVTGVKNQAQCGGCWAFSATGAIESAYAIKTGQLISLSEQNLIDCVTENHGCSGGTMHHAFAYVVENGIEREEDYSYNAKDGTCSYTASKSVLRLSSYSTVTYDSEATLKTVVGTVGPVSVSIDADYIQLYSGGIFDDSACTQSVDHGVLVVGYGTENGEDYWLIKNSWGATWGESGYFKMARNDNDLCGIALWGVYPVI